MAEYSHALTETERAALLARDVGTLYKMGANLFLMGFLACRQVFGLDMVINGERMRGFNDNHA